MKLTIDTQHDTIEDIKKVIQVLTEVIHGKHQVTSRGQEQAIDTTTMMGMFADKPIDRPEEKRTEGTPINFQGFMDLVNKKKDDTSNDDQPRVVSY
jgi:hypothetical protein